MTEPKRRGYPPLDEPSKSATINITLSDLAYLKSIHPKLSRAIRQLIAERKATNNG